MNRIEIIKEDLNIFNATTEDNVTWLLQRLERYEKALKELLTAERDFTLSGVEYVAEEALKDECEKAT